jgi:hypothetical protein
LVVRVVMPEGLLRLCVSVILSSIAILILTVLLGLNQSEKVVMRNMLNKYLKR